MLQVSMLVEKLICIMETNVTSANVGFYFNNIVKLICITQTNGASAISANVGFYFDRFIFSKIKSE